MVELETQDTGCPTGRTGRVQIRGFESLPAFAVRGVLGDHEKTRLMPW